MHSPSDDLITCVGCASVVDTRKQPRAGLIAVAPPATAGTAGETSAVRASGTSGNASGGGKVGGKRAAGPGGHMEGSGTGFPSRVLFASLPAGHAPAIVPTPVPTTPSMSSKSGVSPVTPDQPVDPVVLQNLRTTVRELVMGVVLRTIHGMKQVHTDIELEVTDGAVAYALFQGTNET